MTDHTDLQAKAYNTAPVLTRELPKGIKRVDKYSLVLIKKWKREKINKSVLN